MLVKFFFFFFVFALLLPDFSYAAGCGSRGGPGFRGPKGNCVGWKQLGKVCGSPPTTNCTFEGSGIGDTALENGTKFLAAGAGASSLGLVGSGASNKSKAFNQRALKADGIACASTQILAMIGRCLEKAGDGNSCEGQLNDAVADGKCVRVLKNSEATIQSGSGTFDWVRIKLPEANREYWVDRNLVLE